MQLIPVRNSPETAVRHLRMQAEARAPLDGLRPPSYKVVHLDVADGLITQLIYTRDVGHHASGWFKNPDYERCYHLTISFVHWSALSEVVNLAPFQDKIADIFVRLVYREWVKFIWEESPKTEIGKTMDVRHYRVFCDPNWVPIIPRGEVYNTELTEKGWKSWSEQHGATKPFHIQHENPDR